MATISEVCYVRDLRIHDTIRLNSGPDSIYDIEPLEGGSFILALRSEEVTFPGGRKVERVLRYTIDNQDMVFMLDGTLMPRPRWWCPEEGVQGGPTGENREFMKALLGAGILD